MSTNKPNPDRDQAEDFLLFLDPDAMNFGEPFAFQTYDDDKTRKGPARTLIGTLEQHLATLTTANRDRYAVHVTINDTAGKPRRAENVVRVRKHFVEIDGTMRRDRILKLAESAGLKPAWINESSPGKYHVYFNVADDVRRDLAGFTRRQKQLAALFSGGRESVDLPRVLRVPGFFHSKAKPVIVQCVYKDETAPEHTVAEFERALAGIEVETAAPANADRDVANAEDESAIDAATEHFKAYAPAISNTPSGKLGKQGNATTYDAMVIARDLGLEQETCFALALEHYNPRCDPPWSYEELQTIVGNAYRYGQNAQGSQNPLAVAVTEFKAQPFTEAEELDMLRRAAANTARESKQKLKASTRGSIGDNSGLVTVRLDTVKPRNVDFIWPGRLARGKHTALAGIGGIGKSQILTDMIARCTKGALWPDAKEIKLAGWPDALRRAPKGHCVIMSAEDAPDDTIMPRLVAAGGDPSGVTFLSMVTDGKGNERKFSLQSDLQKLRAYCKSIGNVVLIAIDPASSYMGGDVDASKNTSVRHVLDPITKLAEDLQCAIVSVTHFRKGTGAKAVDKVMDSVAFVNAPRAVFGVYNDPTDVGGDFGPPPYVMLPIKYNLPGERPSGMQYRIEGVEDGGKGLRDYRDDTPIKTSRIVWLGKTDLTADDVAQMENDKPTPRLNEAVTFLRRSLTDGPRLVDEVKSEAEAEGIAPDTLQRAKRKLKVKAIPPAVAGGDWSWGIDGTGAREVDLEPAEGA